MKALLFLSILAAPLAHAESVQIHDLTIVDEEGVSADEMQAGLTTATVGTYPMQIIGGNMPNTYTTGNAPSMVTAGSFPNGLNAANFPELYTFGHLNAASGEGEIPMPNSDL